MSETVPMIKLPARGRLFRYVYFLISGFQFVSYKSWIKRGEPNPFVTKCYRNRVTHRSEFSDIFEDYKKV